MSRMKEHGMQYSYCYPQFTAKGDGTGLKKTRKDNLELLARRVTNVCEECNGIGTDLNGEICPKCEGTTGQ